MDSTRSRLYRSCLSRPLRIGWVASIVWGGIFAPFALAKELRLAQDFETCKAISNDQQRSNCLKNLLEKPAPAAADPWQLVRTPNPAGGPGTVAIMRTADTAHSDPDFAGLIIRCQDANALEIALALVRPFPPRAKPEVVLSWGATSVAVHAEASGVGATLKLPDEAMGFAHTWQAESELGVTIKDPQGDIHGVVLLDGFGPAMTKLTASCPIR
jgi:hypothetical protein